MKHDLDEAVVCVLGLGYVGLPLVEAFSRSLKVIGFDIDSKRMNQLISQVFCAPSGGERSYGKHTNFKTLQSTSSHYKIDL